MNFIQNFNAFKSLIRKEINRTFRIWPQTVFPPLITITLYFIVFGKLIGGRLADIQGFSYLQFIVPGLVMMSIINNAFSATASLVYGFKFQRSIEELLVSPMSNHTILLGFMSGGIFRALFIASLVSIIAQLFTHIPVYHPMLLIFTGLIAACAISLLGIINGFLADSFDDISWIPTFLITPLSYLGGVFYPLTILPSIWQKVSLLNPIFYLMDSFRYSFLNIYAVNTTVTLSLLLFFTGALYGYAYYLLAVSTRLRP